jgi:hypothetical protein
MHGPINVESLDNTSKWQMGFNSAFKGLTNILILIEVGFVANVFVSLLPGEQAVSI